jgi:spore maturation protein SpmB
MACCTWSAARPAAGADGADHRPDRQRRDLRHHRAVRGGGGLRRINAYEAFVEGAKEGFGVAVQIIPYLIAILAAISVFRSTGCMDYLVGGIAAVVVALGLNTDFVPALPVGLMKTLSGSGARGLMVDVMTTYGVDSFQGRLAAIIQGSTETTFYVLAVYFGSVNIRKTRYALTCGLFADAVGVVGAILVGYAFSHAHHVARRAAQPAQGVDKDGVFHGRNDAHAPGHEQHIALRHIGQLHGVEHQPAVGRHRSAGGRGQGEAGARKTPQHLVRAREVELRDAGNRAKTMCSGAGSMVGSAKQ